MYIYISLNNRPCRAGPKLVNISFNEPLHYQLTVSFNKSGGSYTNSDDLYFRIPYRVKHMTVKILNLMSVVNGKRFIVQNDCLYVYWIRVYVIQTNQCKELRNFSSYKNDYMSTSSTCDCGCK